AAGTTPYRYLLRLRLERAATLLRQNTLPLSDIALAVGFNDQSALTHAFRAAYGMPPAQWRKQAMA
ncbi:MAG: helix-turn-helix transcriptional regulator, partial [Pseudomonas sp.]|nr:helix-turn-helix transcriptional regulator [Pseudomonas sp.]